MEAVAKHDFNATADDELSFRKNQVLKVSGVFTRRFLSNLMGCDVCRDDPNGVFVEGLLCWY